MRKAGHEVAFATAPAFAGVVRRAGLEFIPAGLDWDEQRLLETLPELRALTKMYRGEWMMKNIFLDRSPRHMIPDLMAIVPGWRPDLIVSGSFEYGGPLAAEKLGLPYANANYAIRWNRWILKHAVGRPMARLRAEIGLPADPEMKAFGRYLDLCFAPPSWAYEDTLLRPALARRVRTKVLGSDLPLRQRMWGMRALLLQRIFARSQRLRPDYAAVGPTTYFIGEADDPVAEQAEHAAPPPAWLQDMPRQPTIFVSLGTVLSGEYPQIFDRILAGLRDKPVNLIMTLGGGGDPARFGAQPPNVRIVRFMTQGELRLLLPHVDLCINHAGYSSVMEALLRGIPLVLLPLVSDGPMNTQMCFASGVSPDLPPEVWGLSPKGLPIIRAERLTPAILCDAAMQALHDPDYRNAARRMQKQLAERTGLVEAVSLLEQLTGKT
ncbi:MAG TPA: glycosyltransferase [Sphingomonas sp.]|nr:glycosyltransferase [Sphingomonas sp.]